MERGCGGKNRGAARCGGRAGRAPVRPAAPEARIAAAGGGAGGVAAGVGGGGGRGNAWPKPVEPWPLPFLVGMEVVTVEGRGLG